MERDPCFQLQGSVKQNKAVQQCGVLAHGHSTLATLLDAIRPPDARDAIAFVAPWLRFDFSRNLAISCPVLSPGKWVLGVLVLQGGRGGGGNLPSEKGAYLRGEEHRRKNIHPMSSIFNFQASSACLPLRFADC